MRALFCVCPPLSPVIDCVFHSAHFLQLCEKLEPCEPAWGKCWSQVWGWSLQAAEMLLPECVWASITWTVWCVLLQGQQSPNPNPRPSLSLSQHCRRCCEWQEGVKCWPSIAARDTDARQNTHTGTNWHPCAHPWERTSTAHSSNCIFECIFTHYATSAQRRALMSTWEAMNGTRLLAHSTNGTVIQLWG